MRVLDPLLFLVGHRGAIERIAATRHAWVVGAILVLSAGLARNYDHLDLLREPEWFIGPFVASLVSIGFIFLWLAGPLKLGLVGDRWKQQGTFLTLAWMTAPCAWLYGIPVEAMTDIITATKWNIAFLAVVALWRVVIMVRAVSMLTGVSWTRVWPLILAPAALETMVGSFFKGLSLIGIMGGVRLPPHTKLLQEATGFTAVASFWVFVVAMLAVIATKGIALKPLTREADRTAKSGFRFALPALLLWALAAVPPHPEIANRHRLASLIREGDYTAAVAFAASKTRDDFPGIHYFPPEPSGWFPWGLLDALPDDAPAWLREAWTNAAIESMKLGFSLREDSWEKLKARNPSISRAVDEHATTLKARTGLDREERFWLSQYESLTALEAPAADPETKPSPPR